MLFLIDPWVPNLHLGAIGKIQNMGEHNEEQKETDDKEMQVLKEIFPPCNQRLKPSRCKCTLV
jgi:hypothetical protein